MKGARSKDKVDELFAWVPQLIHPFWGALWIGCVTSVAMLFATNSLGVALAGVSTYLVIWAIRLEREWMEVTPLPPLVALSIGAWIRCGAGGFFLSLGKDPGRYNNQEIWRFIVQGQSLWLALMGFLLLAFTIKKPGVVKKIEYDPNSTAAQVHWGSCDSVWTFYYLLDSHGQLERNS